MIAVGSVVAARMLFRLAVSGPDSRSAGYALLGSLVVANLALGLWATRVSVKVLALLAAAVCAFAICVAALANALGNMLWGAGPR